MIRYFKFLNKYRAFSRTRSYKFSNNACSFFLDYYPRSEIIVPLGIPSVEFLLINRIVDVTKIHAMRIKIRGLVPRMLILKSAKLFRPNTSDLSFLRLLINAKLFENYSSE